MFFPIDFQYKDTPNETFEAFGTPLRRLKVSPQNIFFFLMLTIFFTIDLTQHL